MYLIPEDIKNLVSEVHQKLPIQILEDMYLDYQLHWTLKNNDVRYCEYPPKMKVVEESRKLEPIHKILSRKMTLTQEQKDKLETFKHFVKTLWSFGYVVEMKDIEHYYKYGKIKMFI